MSQMENKWKSRQQQDLLQNFEIAHQTRQRFSNWLNKRDIMEVDLPYTHPLLSGGFADWLEEADEFPWLGGHMALLHPDGTSLLAEGRKKAVESFPYEPRNLSLFYRIYSRRFNKKL